jgi:hypothetical protein
VIAGWLGGLLAAAVGLVLAGLAAFGVINSAATGSGSAPITAPLVVYGSR